ncbi:MAG: sulfotransferase [Pseudomonadota bacterium]
MPRPGFAFTRLPRRIFFIGFNKTATSALHLMMLASGVRALHGSGNGKVFGRTRAERATVGHAMRRIWRNLEAGRPPIEQLEAYDCFLDLTFGAHDLCRRFRDFDAAYPDAVFVLNTRDRESWLSSRGAHKNSVAVAAEKFGCDPGDVRARWAADFDAHHRETRAHFAGSSRFWEWDITGDVRELTGFLNSQGVPADPAYYLRVRETGGLYLPPPWRVVMTPTDVSVRPVQLTLKGL